MLEVQRARDRRASVDAAVKVLAILQNQWFHDPEKVRAIIARTPTARRKIITYSLFAGCRTGQMLRQVFGRARCRQIVWDEASPEIGGRASACFPADLHHLRRVLEEVKPSIVLGFGRTACNALAGLVPGEDLVVGPHPTAREPNTLGRLQIMAECLESMLRTREKSNV